MVVAILAAVVVAMQLAAVVVAMQPAVVVVIQKAVAVEGLLAELLVVIPKAAISPLLDLFSSFSTCCF